MNLINIHGVPLPDLSGLLFVFLHIGSIIPLVSLQRSHHRSISRTQFGIITIRVGFIDQFSTAGSNLIFVNAALGDARDKQFINACRSQQSHGVKSSIPHIKTAHHTDTSGIRRPHGKSCPFDTVDGLHMGTKFFINLIIFSLSKDITVKIRHDR